MQNCYREDVPIDFNTIQEKAKSLYDSLKQKEGEESEAGEFNVSKGWFDHFRKRFDLKNIKIVGEAASANQEAADEFLDAFKKSLRGKDTCLNRFLMQMKVSYSGGKKKCHEGHLLVRKRSEYRDLWQERIG